jgi:hypothetical protein
MPKVRVHNVTISPDGFVAGPNQRLYGPPLMRGPAFVGVHGGTCAGARSPAPSASPAPRAGCRTDAGGVLDAGSASGLKVLAVGDVAFEAIGCLVTTGCRRYVRLTRQSSAVPRRWYSGRRPGLPSACTVLCESVWVTLSPRHVSLSGRPERSRRDSSAVGSTAATRSVSVL